MSSDSSDPAVDRGPEYDRQVTIEGQQYWEVGVRVPEGKGEGYVTERIEIGPETEGGELQRRIEEAKERLRQQFNTDPAGGWVDDLEASLDSVRNG